MASSSEGFASLGEFEINGKPVMKLKVDELKIALAERGLEKTGLKKELQERLLKALAEERDSAEANSLSEEKSQVSTEETSIQEVSSTTGETREVNDKNESLDTEEGKDPTEDTGDTGESKEEKKSAEADSTENKEIATKDAEELEDGEILGQEEKKGNQKPVAEKRRIISLTRQTSNPPTPGTRKRKWSSNKANTSVVISTDSLKELIPVVQLASTPALEAVMELDDDKDGEEEVKDDKPEEEKEQAVEIIPNNKPDDKPPYKRRIVQVAVSKTVKLGQTVNEEPAEESNGALTSEEPAEIVDDVPKGPDSHESSHSPATPSSSANAAPVKREISPPRNPPSCAIHVTNLVRPFTEKQLVQHLSTFGAVTEEAFWMNKIKSHCYVIYGSVDEATKARQSMHGQRWPATSARTLRVDFADNDKMLEDTDGALGKKMEESPEQKEEKVGDDKEGSRSKEKSSRKHKAKKEEKKKDEPSAANLLDKLFRKTTAPPCIYWLPLTNEQVVTREKERIERRKQRELQRQQEEQQGDDQKPREAMRNPAQNTPREPGRPKPRESPRDQDRRPLRDNRGGSPPARQRPERRSSPVKRRSRSRSPPVFRRGPNRRR